MSHFFHLDIPELNDSIFAVCKVDVKVLVVDYCYGHYCTMRTRRKCSLKGSYYITRWKYEHSPWILWA